MRPGSVFLGYHQVVFPTNGTHTFSYLGIACFYDLYGIGWSTRARTLAYPVFPVMPGLGIGSYPLVAVLGFPFLLCILKCVLIWTVVEPPGYVAK